MVESFESIGAIGNAGKTPVPVPGSLERSDKKIRRARFFCVDGGGGACLNTERKFKHDNERHFPMNQTPPNDQAGSDFSRAPDGGAPDTPKTYSPRLVFYHPNAKGSGCAVQFDLRPATADREGSLFAAFAVQKTTGGAPREGGGRQAATFHWGDKITVKLGFSDVCQLLSVLEGRTAAAGDGKGLFHDTGETSTVIHMARVAEPLPGVSFEVSKKRRNAAEPPRRARILFNEAETLGLARLFAALLLPLAFGR